MPDNTDNTNPTESSALHTFEEFNLKPEVLESLKKMGFEKPFPVQSMCYEQTVACQDAIVMAQTGTGKTAGFGIPLVQKTSRDNKKIQGLVLVPTRELARQVSTEIESIGKLSGLISTPIYGGTSFSNQVDEINAGVHIVVGTPGRILDHIKRKTIDFSGLETLVLDEADEMLSMGFEREIASILENLPVQRQTVLFSATMPGDIKRLSSKYMKDDVVTIRVSGDAIGAKEISHFVYLVSGAGRVSDLENILKVERPGSAIIFCNTKDETQMVSKALRSKKQSARAINSDLSQAEREKVLGELKANKIQFLVATDIAARGIDISGLSHVINFSFPDSLESYIHRTGRTGRQGRHGAAISLVSPHELGNLYMLRLTYKIFPVEKKLPVQEDRQLTSELNTLDSIFKSVKGVELDNEYLLLADRLLQSEDSKRIVSFLLASYLQGGKEPEAKSKPKTESKSKDKPKQNNRRSNPPKKDSNKRSEAKDNREEKKATAEPKTNNSVSDKKETSKPKSKKVSKAPARLKREVRNDKEQSQKKTQSKPQKKPNDKKVSNRPSKKDWEEGKVKPEDNSVKLSKENKDVQKTRGDFKPDFSDASGTTEIYIDAGRKDGLKISNLMKELVEKSQIPRGEIGKVRMLTRSTSLLVPNSNCERVFKVLKEMKINDRLLKPEYS